MNPDRERPISKDSSAGTILRVALSLFLLYQLVVIVILPNGGSFLGRSLDPWITPYGNFLAFNATWNFFAPDPAHTMYIHYNVRFEDQEGHELKEPLDGYFPPEKEKIVINTSQRRFLYAMRFLILDEKRMKVLLGPFLCRQNPGASSVHIENILEPIPNLDVSQIGELNERQEAKILDHTHRCGETQDEVDL